VLSYKFKTSTEVSSTQGMIKTKIGPERWNINKTGDEDISFEN
jgi:hypothetical protein